MHEQDELMFGFDAWYYRDRYADLAHMSEQEAKDHFVHYGHKEERFQNRVAAREILIPQIPTDAPVLEIGPFGAPQLRGNHVRYADYLSTEELRRRAPDHGFDPEKCPEIHYVLRHTSLGDIKERFAAVFSSHCIEHQPDLIAHLRDVASILDDRGRFFLVIPDKRYCFDHFAPESNIADVLLAHAEKRRLHSLRSLLVANVLVTHNDPLRHWDGDHGEPPISTRGQSAIDAVVDQYKWSMETGEYVDVHAWQFTPQTFHSICEQLFELGLTTLRPVITGLTLRGRTEFCSILERQVA